MRKRLSLMIDKQDIKMVRIEKNDNSISILIILTSCLSIIGIVNFLLPVISPRSALFLSISFLLSDLSVLSGLTRLW